MSVLRFAALILVAASGVADAHQSSVKYVDVAVDGAAAHVKVTVAPSDVTEPLGLVPDSKPTVADASTPAVAAYVARWLALGPADAAPCPVAGQPRAHADADARFVVVEWDVACGDDLPRVAIDLRAFFALDQRHEAIVTVHAPGDEGDTAVVRATAPQLVAAVAAPADASAYLAAGADRIFEDLASIAFLVALLLVAVLELRGSAWAARSPRATLRTAGLALGSLAIAQLAALVAGALGWVQLPAAPLVAVSIAYVAVESAANPAVRYRLATVAAFGVAHGLAFAATLAPIASGPAALAAFAVGILLGELAIAAAALPLLWLACRELGARRYRRLALPVLAAILSIIAVAAFVRAVG